MSILMKLRTHLSLSLLMALMLSACGGGSSSVDSAQNIPKSVGSSVAATLASPSITALTKVRETRIGRTLFEYEFRITVQNGSAAQAGLMARLSGAGAGTRVIRGDVDVGSLAQGAIATPDGTIILRHDRQMAFAPEQLVWQFYANETSPAGLSLTLSQGVVGAGENLAIQATLTDLNGQSTTAVADVRYEILVPISGLSGAVPTIKGNQIVTSPDTRGGFSVKATFGSLVARADFVAVANSAQSENSGQFADLSAIHAGLTSNLRALGDAISRGDSATISSLKGAISDNASRIDLVKLSFGSASAPESGFLPETSRLLAAGLVPSERDLAHADAIAQFKTKLGQITALMKSTTGSTESDERLLQQYLSELDAIARLLGSPDALPSEYALVASAPMMDRLLTQDIPLVMRAIAERAALEASTFQTTAAGQAAGTAQAQSLAHRVVSASPERRAVATAAFIDVIVAAPTLMTSMSGVTKVIDKVYGTAISQITNMVTILAAKKLLDEFLTPTLTLDGLNSSSSRMGPYAFKYPDSTIEVSGAQAAELTQVDVYLIGPEVIDGIKKLGKDAIPPAKISNYLMLFKYLMTVVQALNDAKMTFDTAHQNPERVANNSFIENYGCLATTSSECVELQYPQGFNNVTGVKKNAFGVAPAVPVLILVRTGGPTPKYGSKIFNFSPVN